jgi:hypothetical protein
MPFQLAQVNIAHLRAPLDDPLLASFVARLDEINALAEGSPGFVWRHVSDSRDPSQREYDDPAILFNMSLWQDIATLHAFTYRTAHAAIFARRTEWFDGAAVSMQLRNMALWWLPVGELPSVADAKDRLARLTAVGPSPFAFTFKQRYDSAGRPQK